MSDRAEEFYADLDWPPVEPDGRLETPPRKCTRHRWIRIATDPNSEPVWKCERCPALRDPVRHRRGKSSRRLGADGERRSERRYGWRKTGEFGGIDDLVGKAAVVQQKTTRAAPPLRWKSILARLSTHAAGRTPLLLLSYVANGKDTEDFIVIRGQDWLALFGVDEPEG